MCNLYSVTKGQAAIMALARAMRDTTGNLPPMPGVLPDYGAPIVRNAPDGVRELCLVRWGMPSSSQALFEAAKKRAQKLEAKGKPVDFKELLRMEPDCGTTNIRNVSSKHWQRWLGVEHRCVVPFTSFSEFSKPRGGLPAPRLLPPRHRKERQARSRDHSGRRSPDLRDDPTSRHHGHVPD